MKKDTIFLEIYYELLDMYGLQGWWPLINENEELEYFPGNYNIPHNNSEFFEIVTGCILTQNTNWKSASKAVTNLKKAGINNPQSLLKLDDETLVSLVTPAGFKNQKSKYLRNISNFLLNFKEVPSRKDLLDIKGIGNETCDSILLYGYGKPEFVVDTYTKRFLNYLNLSSEFNDYISIKDLFESYLNPDVNLYREYHSLIVEHGKHFYQKKPYGKNDPLVNKFSLNKI
ncbi:MAG: endonuclease III domain-containing protein [Methanobacteriaceae archaeon]|nr:endonuclease III domain-containing protein [Methanobacteriaceae archaeon]